MTIKRDDFDSPLRPRMKLFLSADIVGSTAYKQPFDMRSEAYMRRSLRDADQWQNAVQDFYTAITREFYDLWSKYVVKLSETEGFNDEVLHLVAGEEPHFWKTVGDEVIFWKELGHECQIWLVLHCWLKALVHVRALLKKSRLTLDIKSTLWVAEFPVRNRALFMDYAKIENAVEKDSSGFELSGALQKSKDLAGIRDYYAGPEKRRRTVDFVGPGIDVGFRVAGFSSLKRLAISVDVAYILALAGHIYEETAANKRNPPFTRDFRENWKTGRSFCNMLKLPDQLVIHQRPSPSSGVTDIKVHFSGTQPLKGVLGGIKYPLFWINMTETASFEAIKEELYISEPNSLGLKWATLKEFCEAFYDDRNQYVSPPIIVPRSRKSDVHNWSHSHDQQASKDIYTRAIDRMWKASGLQGDETATK